MIVKFRERLVVGKQAAKRFDWQRFNLKKLNEPEVREQYQNEITNRFSASENLSDEENINNTWEYNKGSIKTLAKESLGLHELKQHKTLFDEKCLVFLDQGKQAKCTGYRIQTKAIQIILTM